jgi:hypothetical protein
MNQQLANVVTLALNYFKSLFLKPRYYLSVCCIVKNENEYLEEWLSYHLKVGVQHFFVYDNGSMPPVQQTINTLGLSNNVSVISFSGKSKQNDAYQHCLRNFGFLSRWIAFIDVDEFVVPKSKSADLVELLKKFEPFGGLGINWLLFGSSGHLKKTKEPQIERFVLRARHDFSVNRHIKSIVQPKYVRRLRDPHSFKYVMGKYCVNEKFERIDGSFADVSVDTIQINHYFCRSLEEFTEKIARGFADKSDIQRPLEQFHGSDKYSNEVEDRTIQSIVNDIRKSHTAV